MGCGYIVFIYEIINNGFFFKIIFICGFGCYFFISINNEFIIYVCILKM